MSKSIYISGPMRGYPNFNFPAFDAAAKVLRADGWEVLSPAEHDRESGFDETLNSLDGFDLEAAFRWDVESILAADAIAVMGGWRKSAGARTEAMLAASVGRAFFMVNELRYWAIPTPRLEVRVAA